MSISPVSGLPANVQNFQHFQSGTNSAFPTFHPAQFSQPAQQYANNNFLKNNWGKIAIGIGSAIVIGVCAFKGKAIFNKLFKKAAQKATNNTSAENKCLKYFTEDIDKVEFGKVAELDKGTVVAKGSTVEERLKNFMSNPDYQKIPKGNLPDVTEGVKLVPHKYDTSIQDIWVQSVGSGATDYMSYLLKSDKMHQSMACILNNGTLEQELGLVVGKTPAGKAFVSARTISQRLDCTRRIRNQITILSKNGEFTPVQKDLIRTLGSNTDKVNGNHFGMLDIIKNCRANSDYWATSEDAILSGIHSWNRTVPKEQTNRFLQAIENMKNGEFIFDLNSGSITEKMLD